MKLRWGNICIKIKNTQMINKTNYKFEDDNYAEFKNKSIKNNDLVIYFEDSEYEASINNFLTELNQSDINNYNISIAKYDLNEQPKACIPSYPIEELVSLVGPITIFIAKSIAVGILAETGRDFYNRIKKIINEIKEKKLKKNETKFSIRLLIVHKNHLVVFNLYSYWTEEEQKTAMEEIINFLKYEMCDSEPEQGCGLFGVEHQQEIFPLFDTKRGKWIII